MSIWSLVSEDDFSAVGAIDYKPATIKGKQTNLEEVSHDLSEISKKIITQASIELDRAKKARKSSGSHKGKISF